MTLKSKESLLNGKYVIEQVLGQGGFGFVYLAHDTIIGRLLAIKEMNPSLAEDERMVSRFLTEGRATLKLRHPNIVEVYDVFSDRGSYFLAMEYCPGGALDERLDERRFTVNEAMIIMDQICAGVAYSHSQSIVHCDIKPANVLFDVNGVAKVTDFGVAYVSPKAMARSWETVGGFAAGTLFYMAPEQLDGVRDDPRIDVYSLGAVLYEMVTGSSYLDFRTAETISDHVHNALLIKQGTPVSLRQLVPDIPAWLDEVVSLALSKQPMARYPNAGALRTALQRANPSVVSPAPARPTTVVLPVIASQKAASSSPVSPAARRTPVPSFTRPHLKVPPARNRPAWLWRVAIGSGIVLVLAIVVLGKMWEPIPDEPAKTATVQTSQPATATPQPATSTTVVEGTAETTMPLTATSTPSRTSVTLTSPPITATSTRTPTPPPAEATASPTVVTPTPTGLVAPILVSPADGTSVSGETTFSWLWPGPDLATNQAFEVRIWKEGQSDHYGATRLVRSTSVTFNVAGAYAVSKGGSGDYRWTVAVVPIPYQPTGPEATPRMLRIELGGGESGDATPTPTRPP